MSDSTSGDAYGPHDASASAARAEGRQPFPWLRLLYAMGFAIVAWVMFWLIVLLLAPLHYIVLAITGKPNEELREMTLRAVHYLVELLVFVTGTGDEKPFPLGPFPKV
ncbi:MAG TPA: DUF4389 domain-containing protein [Micropepsaceae bacterium]|nr:DUF4389 domain-containing protein [Micropepsaceae bacterium]